jgi:peptide/nickel transport system substrate-binding protein
LVTTGVVSLAMVAAGCTTADDSGDEETAGVEETQEATEEAEDTAATEGADSGSSGTFTYGYEQEFLSYNNNTSAQNASSNAIVLNRVLLGFANYTPDGQTAPTPEFGTFEVTSEEPLTVVYTIDEAATWSDGEPIDCDDMQLAWVAKLGIESGETDPESGAPLILFDPATTAGYDQIESMACADGDKEVTVTYSEPFADFSDLFLANEIMPAHILEQEAGIDDIIPLVEARDVAGLAPASEFWQNGWVFNPGEFNAEISPASGPYMIDSWDAGQSLTLVANPEWWGEPPATETVVLRYIPQEQQAQALQNGEIQAMDPQPNPELVAQLEGIGESVEFSTADQFTWEHLDFNFNTYFSDRNLREAFALCVPRQLIVDNLITPLNPEAVVLNSRKYLPFQEQYEQVVSEAYPGGYDEVDIARATELVQASGQATPIPVRIGYRTPNQRRTDEVALIRDSCNQAGFDIQDIGSEDFFGNGLANGIFDVALFAWAGSALVTGDSSTYVTNGGNNNGKYSNPQVDELTATLNRTLDEEEQVAVNTQIDTILWEDLATIPLFAFPGIVAYDATTSGVEYNASQAGLTWNMDQWAAQ